MKALKPAFLTGRVDLRGGAAADDFDRLFDLAAAIGCPLALQVVIPGNAPASELAPLATEIDGRGPELDSIFVIPARDLKGRPADTTPPGEATAAGNLAAARKAFPGRRLAGGMPVQFTELNRNRPPAGIDFLTHATHAISARRRRPFRHGDAAVAARRHPYRTCHRRRDTLSHRPGDHWAAGFRFRQPAGGEPGEWAGSRLPKAIPGNSALFGAAFALGYIAAVAGEGIEAVTLAAPAGAYGLYAAAGRRHPIAAVIEEVAALSDRRRLGVGVRGPANVDGFAAEGADGLRLLLVNLGPHKARLDLPAGKFTGLRLIDAEAFAVHAVDEIGFRLFDGDALDLDAYAVAVLK